MIARERVKPNESARETNRLGIDKAHAARFYDDARNDDCLLYTSDAADE